MSETPYEFPYDCEELPIIIDANIVNHAPCAECVVKDGAEHTLEDCGLFP
jgi:hypothetical protein